MRFTKLKFLERFGAALHNYSYLGWLIHFIRNQNRPNAVFIWIPKNAGTSLNKGLGKYGCAKLKKIDRIRYRFSQRGLVTFVHVDYDQLVKHDYVSRKFDSTACKFCFCRNPYDRAVSNYVYLTRFLDPKPSFLEFWRDVLRNGVDSIGLYNEKGLSHCNPQVRWIENLEIDFIGRFENLAEDSDRIMKQLGLPPLNLEHRNRSERQSLQDYYCPESKRIIEDFYAEDFRYFGYEIESDESILGR